MLHVLSERSCGHMAQDKGIRKDEESELVKQSVVIISFGHFCPLLTEIV